MKHRYLRARTIALLTASLVIPAVGYGSQPAPPIQPLAETAFRPYVPDPRQTPSEHPTPVFAAIGRPTPVPTATPSPTATPTPRATPRPQPVIVAKPRTSRAGRASYYCCTAGYGDGKYAAAGPKLRVAMGGGVAASAPQPWKGKLVKVCSSQGCVIVRLVDWCQCSYHKPGEKLIDLEPAAMAAVVPGVNRRGVPKYKIAGVVAVKVSWSLRR